MTARELKRKTAAQTANGHLREAGIRLIKARDLAREAGDYDTSRMINILKNSLNDMSVQAVDKDRTYYK